MTVWNGYTKEQIAALRKEGKAVIFRASGYVWIWKEGRVLVCTYDPATERYTRCFFSMVPEEEFRQLAEEAR